MRCRSGGASRTAWGAVGLPLQLDFLGMTGCALLASPDVLSLEEDRAVPAAALPEDIGLVQAEAAWLSGYNGAGYSQSGTASGRTVTGSTSGTAMR